MKKILVFLVVAISILGCATLKPKPDVDVYLRPDVDTSKSKIIAFPMLLTDGKKLKPANVSYSNSPADALFGKQWTDALGNANVVVISKPVLDKIPGAYDAIDKMVNAMDTVSAVEQTEIFKKFMSSISNQFGDGAFAFALVFEDQKEYESKGQLHLNMGLFDTKKLTWKWITKTSYSAGIVPTPYQIAVNNLISVSFEALKEKNNNSVR